MVASSSYESSSISSSMDDIALERLVALNPTSILFPVMEGHIDDNALQSHESAEWLKLFNEFINPSSCDSDVE